VRTWAAGPRELGFGIMAPLRIKPLKYWEDFEVPVRPGALQRRPQANRVKAMDDPKTVSPRFFLTFFVKIVTAVFHCQKQGLVLKEIELIYLDRL